ncbi:hypothetical protein LEP1GSC127_0355 [Leptospira kirschneri str. 200801925]|nr:hypothetical protein LEP1GSC127_0355 [Leptospira kirschneri str. 200801925]
MNILKRSNLIPLFRKKLLTVPILFLFLRFFWIVFYPLS